MVAAVASSNAAIASRPVLQPIAPERYRASSASIHAFPPRARQAWVELDAARVSLRAAADRIDSLIRAISDPGKPVADPVHAAGTRMTLGDAAAHLVLTAQIAVDCFAGFPSPIHDLSAKANLDARFLSRFPERRPDRLADLLGDAVDLLMDAPLGDELVPFHAGISLDPGVVIGLVVADLIAFGCDIARTLGLPWSIEIATGRVAATAMVRMLPFVLTEDGAGTAISARFHVRGGDDLTFRLAGGTATVSRSDLAPVDCHISADPVAFVLVARRRFSRIGRVARGQLVTWGTNPAVAATLPSRFLRV